MSSLRALLLLTLVLQASLVVLGKKKLKIGVCYGLNGDNLPHPLEVRNMYRQYGITKMRLYNPDPKVLDALRGTGLELTLGVLNQDIPTLAISQAAASAWFMANVQPFVKDLNLKYITVGNEVIPGEYTESILYAMHHLQDVLQANGLGTKVTIALHGAVLGESYPPSAGKFLDSASPYLKPILLYLSSQKTPVFVNLYTYFPYASDPAHVGLDYALLTRTKPLFYDGKCLGYNNLLDAELDAFFAAMYKLDVGDVNIVISESGWPHAGNGNLTTPALAATYNNNFIKHVANGATPLRPHGIVDGFIFAMFDENQKEAGVEQNWGLFSPNMQANYDVFGPLN